MAGSATGPQHVIVAGEVETVQKSKEAAQKSKAKEQQKSLKSKAKQQRRALLKKGVKYEVRLLQAVKVFSRMYKVSSLFHQSTSRMHT